MPKRAAPRAYPTPPSFYPEGGEFLEDMYHGEGPRRDAAGRFVFQQSQFKEPTATINPSRPRTLKATYDPNDRTLRIQFRNGRVYGYYDVDPSVWRSLRATTSTGRFINRRLDPFYEYGEEFPFDV